MSKAEEIKQLVHNTFINKKISPKKEEDGDKLVLEDKGEDFSTDFKSGDTIIVHFRIKEGNKERIQQFKGVVIQRKGSAGTEMVTVRKISSGIGVERVFPLHSIYVDKIEVIKRGFVRRARIYYLRKLEGKAARIRGAKK